MVSKEKSNGKTTMKISQIRNFNKGALATNRSKKKSKGKVKFLSLYSFYVCKCRGSCARACGWRPRIKLSCQPVESRTRTQSNLGLGSSGLYTNCPVLHIKQSSHQPQRENLKRLEASKYANLEYQKLGNVAKIF